jgi:CRP-like cAMP-binding protein
LITFLDQCHRRKYPARSTIIYAGDAGDTLFFIISGAVSVVIEDDEGREMVVAYLKRRRLFSVKWGYLKIVRCALLGSKPRPPAK